MNKLYNNQSNITSEFYNFLKINIPNIRKTQLNIIPSILFGMISSKSIVSHDNYTVFMMSMRIGTQGIPIYISKHLKVLIMMLSKLR